MSVEPANLPIEFYRGTDLVIEIQFLDSNGDPVDITGYDFIAHVRKTPNGALVIDLDPTISDAADGKIKIEKSASTTLNFISGSYVWDLIVIDDGNIRSGPYCAGTFIISEPVSK